MRIRLAVLIFAIVGFCSLFAALSPVEANCGYNPCYNRGHYGYGYGYGYQYAQPQYQQQYYYQPQYQPQYQQPVYYQPPVYQQPYYPPQPQYARPCCGRNGWDQFFGNGCCAQAYAQPTYVQPTYFAPEPPRQEWGHHDWGHDDWGHRDWSHNDWGNRSWNDNDGAWNRTDAGFHAQLALSTPQYEDRAFFRAEPQIEETYIQPVPRARIYRKHTRRLDHMSREAFSTAFPNAVIRKTYAPSRPHYVKGRPRTHASTAGNPSTSASSYDVAPRKMLRD